MTSDIKTLTERASGLSIHSPRSGSDWTLRAGEDGSVYNPTGDQPLLYGVLGSMAGKSRAFSGAKGDTVLISFDPKLSKVDKSVYKTWAIGSVKDGSVKTLCSNDPNHQKYVRIIANAHIQTGDAALGGSVKASWCGL